MRPQGGQVYNYKALQRVAGEPAVLQKINKGTFEEKFSRAFETGEQLSQNVTYQQQIVDLSQLEEDVKAIKKNSEKQYYMLPDGTYIEKTRNVTRHIQ